MREKVLDGMGYIRHIGMRTRTSYITNLWYQTELTESSGMENRLSMPLCTCGIKVVKKWVEIWPHICDPACNANRKCLSKMALELKCHFRLQLRSIDLSGFAIGKNIVLYSRSAGCNTNCNKGNKLIHKRCLWSEATAIAVYLLMKAMRTLVPNGD